MSRLAYHSYITKTFPFARHCFAGFNDTMTGQPVLLYLELVFMVHIFDALYWFLLFYALCMSHAQGSHILTTSVLESQISGIGSCGHNVHLPTIPVPSTPTPLHALSGYKP